MSTLNLGVLDFCMLAPGQRPQERLSETLALATDVDRLGYTRYWLSEHHTPDVAHASPEVLVPLILSQTQHLRAGPAGILLRYASPFKVADTFRCIEALAPGRVDLGLARGATDEATGAALLDGTADTGESYARKVADLVGHLRGSLQPDHPHAAARPTPADVSPPELWVLGSSTSGAALSARLGTALSVGLFLQSSASTTTPGIVEQYRAGFQPAAGMARPRWNLAVAGICAETFDDAVRILRQHNNPFIVPNVFGTPEQCYDRLAFLADQYQTDEIVFAALGSTHADRRTAYRLLAHEAEARQHRGLRGDAPLAAAVV